MVELTSFFTEVNDFLWGIYCLIPLLCGTGIYFTLRLRFVQVRKFLMATRLLCGGATLFGKKADNQGMSSFQALATAVAAQVGTGNVAGTATAIVMGGPGAIFWSWIAAFFGMGTIFAEAILAQHYRGKDDSGRILGGPAYYIMNGLGSKKLAIFFSIAIIMALGCIGNMVQSNSIASAFETAFNVPPIVVGLVLVVLAGFVFFGGMARIAAVTEKLVPSMAALYILGGLVVLACNADKILPAFEMIFVGAFNPEAVAGGAVGATVREAMRYGVARGLFSNEAGLGSTPHAHAIARVNHPAEQGLVAIFGVFTVFLIMTITALVILVSGALDGSSTGITLTQKAYEATMGFAGLAFIAVCIFFFAFSTIVGWYFFGEQNVRFLVGPKGVLPYRLLVLAFLVMGALLHVDLVWQLADFFNGLMAFPNLIALIGLGAVVSRVLHDFDDKLAQAKKAQ